MINQEVYFILLNFFRLLTFNKVESRGESGLIKIKTKILLLTLRDLRKKNVDWTPPKVTFPSEFCFIPMIFVN